MLILINISGDDRPGLTAEITALLSAFNADILDVGQAVIHNHLSLGILVSLADVFKNTRPATRNRCEVHCR